MRSRCSSATSTSARIAASTPLFISSAASRAKRWRSSATWSLRLRPVCSLRATSPTNSSSRRSTAVCTSSSSSVQENSPASTSASTASRPRTNSSDSSGVMIPCFPSILAWVLEPRTSYGASRTSKGMEALRRSNASAGEAPNLPPQRGLLLRSLMALQFSGRLEGRCARVLSSPHLPYSPNDPALPGSEAVLPVSSYGGLEGAEAQSGVADAAPDHIATQLFDEGSVVEVEDLVHREGLVVHLLHDDRSCPHADGIPRPGEGEVFDPVVAIPLEVDDDRAPTLRAAAGHRHVRAFESPRVARVRGVVHEQRYAVLPIQEAL